MKDLMIGTPKGVSITTKTITTSPGGEGDIFEFLKSLMSGSEDIEKRKKGIRHMGAMGAVPISTKKKEKKESIGEEMEEEEC